ncbi:MFS transporter [Rhodococcus sp. NPDC019627]|uniref:MFS transporter n=1 Tax=unclassified Rhodococcus (in: high G+C Gram-positive bacteria) TaxID=192944 RepID=UPI0033D0A7FF
MPSSTAVPTNLSGEERENVVGRVFRRILPLVFPIFILSYLDRVNLGYAQLGMGAELGITAAGYGLASAVFFISYFFFEVPSNMLAQRFGSRAWLTRIMISWGVITVFTGFVTNEHMLYVARFLLGVAEAGFLPAMVLYLTQWFRARDRAQAMAWLFLAHPIAFLLGGVIGGLILDHVHWLGLSPWQWVFILTGVPSVLFGFVTWKKLPESPASARWLSDRERRWLVRELDEEGGPSAEPGLRAQLAALLNGRVLYLSIALLTFGIGFYGFNLFVPLILKQINPDFSATNIGMAAIAPYACAALATLLLPKWANSPKRSLIAVTVLSFALALGLTGVIAFRHQPGLALVALTLAAIGSFAFLPLFWAMTTTTLSKTHAIVGVAVINSMANLGGFIGPYLVGKGTSGSTVTSGLLIPVISCVVCTVLLLFWKKLLPSGPSFST